MYVNNEIGTIQEIKNISKKIKRMEKEKGRVATDYPYFHTDASQTGNYLSLYIDMLGVDMLSLNGSKIYGPKSSAIFFKKNMLIFLLLFWRLSRKRDFLWNTRYRKAVGISFAIFFAQNEINTKSYNKLLEKLSEKKEMI